MIRWPYTEPHIAYARWGARMADGTLLKGLSMEDVIDMRHVDPRVAVLRQTVVYVNGGPDEGHEVLSPWQAWSPPGDGRDQRGQHPEQ